MRVNLRTAILAARIEGDDDTLASEAFGGFANKIRIVDRRGVQRDFIGSAAKDLLNVIDAAQSAAYRERNIDGIGNAPNHFSDDVSPVGGRRNVEEDQFIGTFFGIAKAAFDRIAGITEV